MSGLSNWLCYRAPVIVVTSTLLIQFELYRNEFWKSVRLFLCYVHDTFAAGLDKRVALYVRLRTVGVGVALTLLIYIYIHTQNSWLKRSYIHPLTIFFVNHIT